MQTQTVQTQTVGKGPLPVKLYGEEDTFLHLANDATGVPIQELVRRGIRLMERQHRLFNSFAFVLELKREQNKKG